MEGNTIKAVGTYFGGKEGQSEFEWLREGEKFGYVVINHDSPLDGIRDTFIVLCTRIWWFGHLSICISSFPMLQSADVLWVFVYPHLFFIREFDSVAKGTKEYTLSKEDVGSRMMFTYTPVNHEGA